MIQIGLYVINTHRQDRSTCSSCWVYCIGQFEVVHYRASGVSVLPNSVTHIVARHTDVGAPRCFAPKPDDPLVVAHGHVNGTVNVTGLHNLVFNITHNTTKKTQTILPPKD